MLAVASIIAMPLSIYAYSGGFTTAPLPLDQPVGYIAQDELTGFDLTGRAVVVYRPEYNRQNWSGDLHAYSITSTAGIGSSQEIWTGGASPANILTAQNWDTGRFIATMNDAGVGVPFRDTSMSATSFPTPPAISGKTYSRAHLLAFLRGDTSNEGSSGLRQRSSPLGDIIHSRPYYLRDDNYATVFVGANDGMLHAFDASTGSERWAYVPSMLQGKLKTLAYNPLDASNPYKHDYFVDGQINVGLINGGAKKVLFGSLGGGGPGIYALDISQLNASSDADVASKVLWEITPDSMKSGGSRSSSSAYANLGYSYGTPLLIKLNIGGAASDALIIGNGYNTAGYAYLYVINAATGAQIAAIRAGSGIPAAGSANGIFEPKALDTSGKGVVDRVYAADLNGNLWKFDLSSTSASDWSVTSLFSTANHLPVTSTLGIIKHPNGGYMIDFGTGSTLSGAYGTYNHTSGTWTKDATGDLTTYSPATYYVYGIWDNGSGTAVIDSDLVLQTLEERLHSTPSSSTRVRRASANTIDWTKNRGWKLALPVGERIIGEGSFVENGRFYFTSYNPTVAPLLIAGSSSDIFGENWLMELNALTGGSSSAPIFDLYPDHILDNKDRISYGSGDTIPSGSSSGSPIIVPNEKGIPVGKFMSTGVQSQPLLLASMKLNTTLMNHNPDASHALGTNPDHVISSIKTTHADNSYTVIVTSTAGNKTSITTTDYTASGNLVTSKTMVIADSNGSTLSGGDERGINLRSKRISWRELMGQ